MNTFGDCCATVRDLACKGKEISMYAYALTGWLVTGALPMGGVASASLGWALPIIAAVMLLLLALLVVDTAWAAPRAWTCPRRGRLGGPRRPAAFDSVDYSSVSRV